MSSSKHKLSKRLSRRRLLQLGFVSGLAGVAYAHNRGLRYPTLSLESAPLPTTATHTGFTAQLTDLIEVANHPLDTGHDQLASQFKVRHSLRAYAPEPSLQLSATSAQTLTLSVNNIATDAHLLVGPNTPVKETIQGINRQLSLTLKADQQIELKWRLPKLNTYTFASIGDSGGDKELGWCIQRAHQLGARFLLHLGDFNYQAGDYDNAVQQFYNSPIPCYVAVGNHDFHESGLIYSQFLNQIGPLSHQFKIGKTRFANIDTAASTWPHSGGHRGRMFEQMIAQNDQFNDTVAFTHRPLHDPIASGNEHQAGHDIGSIGERDWLIAALKRSNAGTLLSGHIHIYDRTDFAGIDNIIVGQGLGHQDLLVNGDHSKIAIGEVAQDGRVSYRAEPLAMPMALHCHPRSNTVKESVRRGDHPELIKYVDQQCKT